MLIYHWCLGKILITMNILSLSSQLSQSSLGNKTFIFMLKIQIVWKVMSFWNTEMNYTFCKHGNSWSHGKANDNECIWLFVFTELATVMMGKEKASEPRTWITWLSSYAGKPELHLHIRLYLRLSILQEYIGGVRIQSFKSFPLWFS